MLIASSQSEKEASQRLASERFSVARAEDKDREEIYRIRHEVYARELGQHAENPDGELHDSLDTENVYITAKIAGGLAGFISITPPGLPRYSIDKYFERESLPFRVPEDLYEIRLLTVLREHRGSELATLLMYAAFRWVEAHGGKQIVAIGRREVVDLYTKAGLKPLGPSVSCGRVKYDLLHGSVSDVREKLQSFQGLLARLESRSDWLLDFSFHRPAGCFHGGDFFKAIGEDFKNLERKENIINADVLDAWFPPAPQVSESLVQNLEWLIKTSPPTDCKGLVGEIARARGVKPMNILPGAGSSDLIFRALPRWLSPSSHVLILDPTYGEYSHALERVIGATVDRLPLFRENNYKLNLGQLQRALKDNYDLVVLVNPNSPTGQHVPRSALEDCLRTVGLRTRVWVDETYVEYAGPNESLEKFAVGTENVIVCKSMSKVYALSGMRIAYLCAGACQLEALRAVTPPWVVSLPGQLAATIALRNQAYYERRYVETHTLRQALAQQLEVLGWQVVPGVANFLLAHLPENGMPAQHLVEECQKHGLFLRNAALMGSQVGSRVIRVAVKDAATNARMVSIISKVQNSFADGVGSHS